VAHHFAQQFPEKDGLLEDQPVPEDLLDGERLKDHQPVMDAKEASELDDRSIADGQEEKVSASCGCCQRDETHVEYHRCRAAVECSGSRIDRKLAKLWCWHRGRADQGEIVGHERDKGNATGRGDPAAEARLTHHDTNSVVQADA
jgi:hypothetical protein